MKGAQKAGLERGEASDARSPVRHGAGAEPPPCHQAKQSKKEVLTFNRDLTSETLRPGET